MTVISRFFFLILQAEDLNSLIGNAFRVAYAVQIQDGLHGQDQGGYAQATPAHQVQRPGSALGHHQPYTSTILRPFPQSRSADSLLSPDILHGTADDLGIADVDVGLGDQDDPLYETPDFVRSSHLRLSDNTFNTTV